jgi:UDP:flavonoid glycosyltransferase YjiC (YdhE family)
VARYLMAASPLAGHVMPMLGIAADLQRRGHDVTFLSGAQYGDAITRLGMTAMALPEEAQPAPPSHRGNLLRSPTIIDLWRSGRTEMLAMFVEPLGAQYRALRAALDDVATDAVVVDIGFTGALPLLLDDRDRPPVAVCGVGPLMLSSVDTPSFGVGWHPRPGLGYGAMNWFVHNVLFADVQARLNGALRGVDVQRSPVFLTDWPTLADRVLQLTVPGTEYPRRDLPSSVVFTGPVIAEPVVEVGVEVDDLPCWRDRLRAARTVVHVTQGTWDNRDHGQLIAPTLDGLADHDDVLVIATSGLPEQPAYAGTVPANAVMTDYVPYAALLPHVDVMITNGGYGGVQHALRHGIPLIVAGRTADKPEVAARVEYSGAGIDLKTDRPTPGAIAAAVQQILTTDRYRDAARRISRDMAATTPFDTIDDVLAELRAANLSTFGSHP